ncbi:MAG: DNA-binding response regulator [Acidobacteria bacterium]|nr:MAG: DNA-binding response regulator [Acidobacteriota bacterium]
MPIRLTLADDHPVVLQGLQRLFETQHDFNVVACCGGGDGALESVRHARPDVLVLDLRMPGCSGLDVLRAMAAEKLPCRTVLLTAAITDNDLVEAVRLGVNGIIMKQSPPDALVECVRRVARGEQSIERDTLAKAFGRVLRREAATREVGHTLTPREIEIVQMVAHGLRNRAIAERLAISEGTVKIHLHNIYEKLGIDGRLELMLWAQEQGVSGS